MSDTAIITALGALAQTHRLAAFRVLVQAGPVGIAAGALADMLGLQPSALSFHLAQLVGAGLIAGRRDGRHLLYTADFGAMTTLVDYLTENCCGGVPCAVETNIQRTLSRT